jgi:PleD family two-component response regulator
MIKATVSAGIAQVQAGATLDSLVQAADLALYRAKLQGRDRVEVAEKNDVPIEDQPSEALKVA